jgi:hypothetical protein
VHEITRSRCSIRPNLDLDGHGSEYHWRQPHIHIIVQVPKGTKDARTVGTWDFESAGPNIASRQAGPS